MSPVPRHDAWHLAPIDIPARPQKGMKIWVKRGPEFGDGDRFGVSRVNPASFYLSAEGEKIRMPISAWRVWLRERMADGEVTINGHPLHLNGASSSDGEAPTSTSAAAAAYAYSLSAHGNTMAMSTQSAKGTGSYGVGSRTRAIFASLNSPSERNVQMRDARVFRAIRQVLKDYKITEKTADDDAQSTYHVQKGRKDPYIVHVDPSWELPVTCSCPDSYRSRDAAGNVFCKHSIAVCLSSESLRHLLIDLFI
jgi:hypothetical protein